MKFDIISDIHLTAMKDHGDKWIADYEPKGDHLILAGDVGEFHWWQMKGYYLMKELCAKYAATGEVYFVPGNHDYYGTTFENANARFKELEDKIDNFNFLNADYQVNMEWIVEDENFKPDPPCVQGSYMDGVTIYGATLWFPYDPENPRYSRYLSDFSYIKGFVPKVYDVHRDHVAYLSHITGDKKIVITHHMPSFKSVHPRFENDDLNRFFVSNQEEIMYRWQPTLWVHGHTHHRFDYMIDKTRVICNPLGYPRENPGPYGPVTVDL